MVRNVKIVLKPKVDWVYLDIDGHKRARPKWDAQLDVGLIFRE